LTQNVLPVVLFELFCRQETIVREESKEDLQTLANRLHGKRNGSKPFAINLARLTVA
jgi:hypothetical protein